MVLVLFVSPPGFDSWQFQEPFSSSITSNGVYRVGAQQNTHDKYITLLLQNKGKTQGVHIVCGDPQHKLL